MRQQFEIIETGISGCMRIDPLVRGDERGFFIKTFHHDAYESLGLNLPLAEEYFSFSHKGVLRGLHFQVPPMDGDKLVCCVSGRVMDVAVDLRVGSPTYGRHEVFELSGDHGNMVFIPSGMAHGFYVLSENAILLYKVGSVYSPEHDAGIHWASAGISWPDPKPVLSIRDQSFPSLAEFNSPFRYKA